MMTPETAKGKLKKHLETIVQRIEYLQRPEAQEAQKEWDLQSEYIEQQLEVRFEILEQQLDEMKDQICMLEDYLDELRSNMEAIKTACGNSDCSEDDGYSEPDVEELGWLERERSRISEELREEVRKRDAITLELNQIREWDMGDDAKEELWELMVERVLVEIELGEVKCPDCGQFHTWC